MGSKNRLSAGWDAGEPPKPSGPIEGTDMVDGSVVLSVSHREGAVAKKNLSLSRWEIRSCSW